MAGDEPTPESRIAEAFNSYFSNFDICIEADDVSIGRRQQLVQRGWRIAFRILADDAGSPSLEFYATHRMTNDRHVRIWADGYLEGLEAINEGYGYNPKVPGSKEGSEREYLKRNRRIAHELRAAGLYPEGDINTYLRTGEYEETQQVDELSRRRNGQDIR